MNINQIREEWKSGQVTHRELRDKHGLTAEQELAITATYSDGLPADEVERRLEWVEPGMPARVIRAVMRDEPLPASGKYAGADWIRKAGYDPEMSCLGEAVADLLGDLYLGIYHMNTTSLRKVDWSNDTWIEVTVGRELATVDNNMLTRLVVLAHDRMLRVSIKGIAPGYMRLMFHRRTSRDGRLMDRCPHLDDHISHIRRHYYGGGEDS